MNRYLRLLCAVFVTVCMQCSSPGESQPDLGNLPADLSAPSDFSVPPDLSPPAPTTLSFVAERLGGIGNADDTGAFARFNFPAGMAVDGAGNL